MLIDEAEGRRIVALPKQALYQPLWIDRQNHAGSKHCTSGLEDADGITLPGLTVTLEVKASIVVSACLFQFTIFKLLRGQRVRAYQLEVCPRSKRSHRDKDQILYGPHEHFGDAAFSVDDPTVDCESWSDCLAWFLNRCNLTQFDIQPP